MTLEADNPLLYFALFRGAGQPAFGIHASSHERSDWESIESLFQRWALNNWGNCRVVQFVEAVAQVPLGKVLPGSEEYWYLLLSFRGGRAYGLELPIRFAVLVPDPVFRAYRYDVFTLRAAGAFDFASPEEFRPEEFQPNAREKKIIPASLRSPDDSPKPDETGWELAAARTLANSPVLFDAECLSEHSWGSLATIWRLAGSEVRQQSVLYTQNFAPKPDLGDRYLTCQYRKGVSLTDAGLAWFGIPNPQPPTRSLPVIPPPDPIESMEAPATESNELNEATEFAEVIEPDKPLPPNPVTSPRDSAESPVINRVGSVVAAVARCTLAATAAERGRRTATTAQLTRAARQVAQAAQAVAEVSEELARAAAAEQRRAEEVTTALVRAARAAERAATDSARATDLLARALSNRAETDDPETDALIRAAEDTLRELDKTLRNEPADGGAS